MFAMPFIRATGAVLGLTVLALAGCQSGGGRPAVTASTATTPVSTPPDPLAAVSPMSPTDFAGFSYESAIDDDPQPLGGSEIEALYSGVAEAYGDLDEPGVRVASTYTADGAMAYAWSFRGEVRAGTGRWYVRNDQLCIDYDTAPPTPETPDPYCRTMVRVARTPPAMLGSLNARGYVGGAHGLQPLP